MSTLFGKQVVDHLREVLELLDKVNEIKILQVFRAVLEQTLPFVMSYIYDKLTTEKVCIKERKRFKIDYIQELINYVLKGGKIYVFILPYFDSSNYACALCAEEHGRIVPILFVMYNLVVFKIISTQKMLYLLIRSLLSSICCLITEKLKISEQECYEELDNYMEIMLNPKYKCSHYFEGLLEKITTRDVDNVWDYIDRVVEHLFAKVKFGEIQKIPEIRYDFCSRILPKLKDLKDIYAIKEITEILARYKLGFEIKGVKL